MTGSTCAHDKNPLLACFSIDPDPALNVRAAAFDRPPSGATGQTGQADRRRASDVVLSVGANCSLQLRGPGVTPDLRDDLLGWLAGRG